MVGDRESSFQFFWRYFRESRLLKLALAFNLLYYIAVIVLFGFYLIQGRLNETIYTMDIQVFYEAGLMFLASPGDIYTVAPNGLPYRYLPSFAAGMALLSNVPFYILYVINISFMMMVNFGIVFLVYLVSFQGGVNSSTKNFEKTLAILFIAPQHIINIILGQITQLAILLVLLALYLLHPKGRGSLFQFFCIGILIGIASILKPFFLVLIPFLIPITLTDRFRIKISLNHLIGVSIGFLLTMIPNIFYFITYPSAIDGFIQANFADGLSFHHSTSITRLIIGLLPAFNSDILQLSLILVLGGFLFLRSYIRFVRTPESEKNYLHHFTDMIFLILLVYPDSWFLFLAVWYAFMGPSMLQLYNISDRRELRNLDLLWSGSNNILAFFSFGIVIHYLVLGIDPINPIWILILYLLYHRLFSRASNSNSSFA
ncbi:MAG: hypothetical protein ACFFEF_03015 [Candidatus Thorarchaeota archaeon]